jgi:lysophospholipase L1-like esterase
MVSNSIQVIDWVPPESSRLCWHGIADFESVEDGLVPWRLPFDEVPLLSPGLATMAQVASGVRIRFRTDASEVRIRATNDQPAAPITLVGGDGHLATRDLTPSAYEVSFGDPKGEDVEIWLPHRGRTVVAEIGVSTGAAVEPREAPSKRWLAYGSSITQSMGANDPASTWPATVAREHDLDLVNLGFASEAHLDPVVARYMARVPADVVTLCVGINVYVGASMSLRTYRSNLAEFIRVVRSGHPGVPIVVLSAISSPGRETVPCYPRLMLPPIRRRLNRIGRLAEVNALFGPTLEALREETASVVELLVRRGDQQLSYLDGRTILGADESDLLADGLHPTAAGEEVMAERLSKALAPLLG